MYKQLKPGILYKLIQGKYTTYARLLAEEGYVFYDTRSVYHDDDTDETDYCYTTQGTTSTTDIDVMLDVFVAVKITE